MHIVYIRIMYIHIMYIYIIHMRIMSFINDTGHYTKTKICGDLFDKEIDMKIGRWEKIIGTPENITNQTNLW